MNYCNNFFSILSHNLKSHDYLTSHDKSAFKSNKENVVIIQFFQYLLHDSNFPILFSPKIRLRIISIKEKIHRLIKSIDIREVLASFHTHIKLSDVFREQERILHLTYSTTTALKPINFDLSIFFITSPPALNQVISYAN